LAETAVFGSGSGLGCGLVVATVQATDSKLFNTANNSNMKMMVLAIFNYLRPMAITEVLVLKYVSIYL